MFYLRNLYCGDYEDCVAKSGIYKIHFVGSNNFYVGSAVCFSTRWSIHRNELARGSHCNPSLKRAWAKYGAENIRFTILEVVDEKTQLIPREQFWMDQLMPAYNVAPKAGSQLGFRHGPEARAKVSASSKGRPKSPETIAKWLETMNRVGGFIKSPEVGMKISAAKMGKPRPDIKGKKKPPMPQETRDKISATKKANPVTWTVTEEGRAKMRAAALLREAAKKARGYYPSPEAIENLRNAGLARWARARELKPVFD
ncbi:MAG TPA: GIY-YIG nuclease family protein [Bacteroidia bacterium]|nr:GIY-YIG nuclease family protein [Bacteroidia bacterium]